MSNLPDIQPALTLAHCDAGTLSTDIFDSSEPVLLKGLVSSWPAVEQCASLGEARAYLSRFWSDKPITAYVGDEEMGGRFFYNDDFSGFNFRGGRTSLQEVFDKLGDDSRPLSQAFIYVGSSPADVHLPGFTAENQVQVPADEALVSLWLGNRTRISAHYDFPDNLACLVSGRRRFTLFPPEQVKNLYVGPLDRTPSGQAISLVDFSAPDFRRYPKFREAMAQARSAELAAGDALFIPSMWWHHVEAREAFNFLINYWWTLSPVFMGSPTVAMMHAILSIRDLPLRQRQAWRHLFEHYVFGADEDVYSHVPEAGRGCLAPLTEEQAHRLRAGLLSRLNQ